MGSYSKQSPIKTSVIRPYEQQHAQKRFIENMMDIFEGGRTSPYYKQSVQSAKDIGQAGIAQMLSQIASTPGSTGPARAKTASQAYANLVKQLASIGPGLMEQAATGVGQYAAITPQLAQSGGGGWGVGVKWPTSSAGGSWPFG